MSSSSSESSHSAEEGLTCNEGVTTVEDEVAPADASIRGRACLVTASCPRQYPRCLKARMARRSMLPADFSKEEFLSKLRQCIDGTLGAAHRIIFERMTDTEQEQ